jgi:hypothetical protein
MQFGPFQIVLDKAVETAFLGVAFAYHRWFLVKRIPCIRIVDSMLAISLDDLHEAKFVSACVKRRVTR